ncbi:hypothetical protein BDF19DRAFT_419226 [Syncephalis fuscata]|nr:hypothetical protein BDF19DRAFT_419226 [Syncephalis fuscata]
MTVSVIQAMPVNEMPSLPESEPIESPFTIYDIQFTDNPYEVKGVHYIKGTQHSQPITLVFEPNSNTSNPAFQVYKDLMLDPKSVKSDRFLVPDFAQKYTSGARLVQLLWQNIGSGLDAIKEAGWYSHMDFKATTFMLVLATQVTYSNAMPGSFNSKPEPKLIEFMRYKNSDSESPFTIYDIQFTDNPYEVKGVHYIKGTQYNQPITLTCGSDPNPNIMLFKYTRQVLCSNRYAKTNKYHHQQDLKAHSSLFSSTGQCEQTYKQFAENPLSAMQLDMKKILDLWRNIGLDAIGKTGWHVHKNLQNICITKKKDGKYMPQFFNFDNAISAKKELDYETEIMHSSLNRINIKTILQLVPDEVKIEIFCKLTDDACIRKTRILYKPSWIDSRLYDLNGNECLKKADAVTIYSLEKMLLTNNPNWHPHQ